MTTTYATATDRHSFITADKPGTVTHRFRGQAHLAEHGNWYAACGRIVPGFVDDERDSSIPVCSACAKRLA
jgi:hypothetical protein